MAFFFPFCSSSRSRLCLFFTNASTSSCRQCKYASIIKTGIETTQNTHALEFPGRKSPLIEKILATVDKGIKSMVNTVILDKLCAFPFDIRASWIVMYCRYPLASAFVNPSTTLAESSTDLHPSISHCGGLSATHGFPEVSLFIGRPSDTTFSSISWISSFLAAQLPTVKSKNSSFQLERAPPEKLLR